MMKKFALAAALAFASVPAAMAAECAIEIDGTDTMQYQVNGEVVKEIVVDKSCDEFTINMKHIGSLPIASMGHNVVIAKDADRQAVATNGIAAGLEKSYVKEGDDRVVAFSDTIGGGEETSVTFNVADLQEGEDYSFFCTFPGHVAIMNGALIVK